MATETDISIIALNVNRLKVPTKRHRLAEWIQKQDPYISVYKIPTSDLNIQQTESESMGKYIPCKWEAKEKWSSNQTKRTLKQITRDKEGHYIMIKGSIQEEE